MVRWISIFPLHGSGRFVVLTDVSQEFFVQIRNGSEYASGDDVALDLAEPQLDLIQPRRVGRSEVQVNLGMQDRKSTRLNSSHANISYAVFCLKKKKKNKSQTTQRQH